MCSSDLVKFEDALKNAGFNDGDFTINYEDDKTAASGALSSVFPERAKDIVLYAGASQVLTSATGLYMSIFLLLPLTRGVYRWLSPLFHGGELEENGHDQ